ncbi:MAG: hypothetical protein E7279_04350 [Lachnospiraceae bacterium]|nr:hypothetical protein [Lachnospiraceae bacterium]
MKKRLMKRRMLIVSLVMTLLLSSVLMLGGCGCSGSDKKVAYSWPTTGLATLLPEPEFKYGKITKESANEFEIEFYDVEQKDFDSYVDSCKSKGLSVDFEKKNDSYMAKDAKGNLLSIEYRDYSNDKELVVKVESAQKIAEDVAKQEQMKAEQEAKKQAEEAAKAEQAKQQAEEAAKAEQANQQQSNNAMQQANDAIQNYNDTVRQSKELVDSYSNLLDQVSKFQ